MPEEKGMVKVHQSTIQEGVQAVRTGSTVNVELNATLMAALSVSACCECSEWGA